MWANKLLLGGSAFDQTGGAVLEVAVSGTNVTVVGSTANLTVGSITFGGNLVVGTGSPYSTGIVYPFTARTVITGGMWVTLSGPGLAMGSPALVAAPPIGVALATAGSNATVNVLVHGIYPFVAEGTVEAGDVVKKGVGVALNTVLTGGSPSYGAVGQAITRGASEATILVYIGKGASF